MVRANLRILAAVAAAAGMALALQGGAPAVHADYTVGTTLDRPGPPANPTAINATRTSVHLDWDAPAGGDGNAPVDDYKIRYTATEPPGNWTEVFGHRNANEFYTMHNLEPGTEYRFEAAARNAPGWGAWSNHTIGTTLSANP